ncbi:MAG: autotransporter-associated beta strand repeat-containing protein [Luteolibacter sp.]
MGRRESCWLISTDGVNKLSGTVAIGASGGTFKSQWRLKDLVVNGAISGSGPVTIDKLAGDGGSAVIFAGANTYNGTTTINGGVLQFAKQVSLYNNITASWTAANLTVASGTTAAFNVGGAGEFTSADIDTIKGLSNVGATAATQGFKNGSILGLDTTNAGGNFTYANALTNHVGTVTDTLGLTKLGTGTLTLSGSNTYTGATTISAGTLVLSGTNTTGCEQPCDQPRGDNRRCDDRPIRHGLAEVHERTDRDRCGHQNPYASRVIRWNRRDFRRDRR